VSLRQIHADFAWVVVGTNAAVGAWALGAHWLERLRSPLLWRATVVAELTIVVEVVLGVALVAIDDYEVAQFHAFYGFVALATIGIVYSYRHQVRAHLYLLYGLGGLFLMGLALRAIVISPIPP
jgi:predicted transporter